MKWPTQPATNPVSNPHAERRPQCSGEANPWFTVPALLFLNVGLGLLLFVPYGAEVLYFNPWRTEPLNTFFRFCTALGEPLVFVGLGLFVMLFRYRYALLIALAGLIITPVSYILKDHVGTDRPITFFEKLGLRDEVALVPRVELNGGQTSFPSGHTMAAFGMYGLVALMAARRAPWLGLACAWTAFLVALSRIFLVQHFLIDVLGGAAMGLLIAWLVCAINARFFHQWSFLDRGILPRRLT